MFLCHFLSLSLSTHTHTVFCLHLNGELVQMFWCVCVCGGPAMVDYMYMCRLHIIIILAVANTTTYDLGLCL